MTKNITVCLIANAFYVCINYGEAICPDAISQRSLCINGDIGEILNNVMGL